MPVVVRETPLAVAIADVSRNPRPFVIFNRESHPEAVPPIPPHFLAELPRGFTGDLLVAPTTLDELTQVHLPVGRHREQFLVGDPVMMSVETVHEIPERAWGGQSVAGLVERARDGLYVTVALATERMRACADLREHRKRSKAVRRGDIFTQLEPLLPGLSPSNLFREGQALLVDWFPGQTAHHVLKATYKSIVDMPGARTGEVNFAAIESKQVELVATAGAVYEKTLAFVRAQHEMSALIRELMESTEFRNATPAEKYDMQAAVLREKGPAAHQELAHDKQGGPTLAQLMLAAAAMDFNPGVVFLNDRFMIEFFDCGRRLGRAERGHYVWLEPAHIEDVKAAMTLEERPGGDQVVSPLTEAGKCLRDLALKVRPRSGWDEFFALVGDSPDGSAITKSMQ